MIKTLRKGAIENPWFFRIIMALIAVAFIITMGWGFGDFGSRSASIVATVDGAEIGLSEYQRVYKNLYDNFRERAPEGQEIDEEMFRQVAIDQLVNRRLWLKAAQQMRLSVSDHELMESISKIPAFHSEPSEGKPGRFDPERYRRVLEFARLSPEVFERSHQEDLLIEKVKGVVRNAVELTPQEIEEARSNSPEGQDPERAVSDALFLKRQKALLAFSTNLKARSHIEINHDLL